MKGGLNLVLLMEGSLQKTERAVMRGIGYFKIEMIILGGKELVFT